MGKTDKEVREFPTDVQLLRYADGESNPELEALYFQYGRYLLISSSRTEGVPANLQGLWNEDMVPPWSSNYTTNINLEENYWAAESSGLPEMHEVLLGFIRNLSATGEASAKNYYGIGEGWSLAHNTDRYEGEDARRGGGTYPNLFDAHSPFQIDGNFGGCAGVIEMLVQSDPQEIYTLPALPSAWPSGHIKGVRTRTGQTVYLQWKDGKVKRLKVRD